MVGERSKTDLAIVYMDDLVQPELLEKVRQKVNALSFDGILDGGMVEQLLEENVWTPFPQFQHTERPDKAAQVDYWRGESFLLWITLRAC